MKKRLIDMDVLLQKLNDAGGCDAPKDSWADGYDSAINLAYKMTQDMPLIDADVVVHGEWQPLDWEDVNVVKCSICGEEHILDDWMPDELKRIYIYCPNCGAKMDGERKER